MQLVAVELRPAVEEPRGLHRVVGDLLQNLDQIVCLAAGEGKRGASLHERKSNTVFPPSTKRKGGRYNFSMRSKQIKHPNDHIKLGKGGSTLVPPFGGNTGNMTTFH